MDPLVVADWGGSIAGAISIVFLLRKSLGYWYWSIVATLLWLYLFIETESLMVAGLQLFYTAFAVYGIARWHLERRSLAVPRRLDHAGALVAVSILVATIALSDFASWASWIELTAVALSILANWLTALKVVWCWPIWIATNVLFGILFWHLGLWGLFGMQFLYGALSVVGWWTWRREASPEAPRPGDIGELARA